LYRTVMVKMWADCGGITKYPAAKVIAIDTLLIKLKSGSFAGGGEVIFNTASLAFVSAEVTGE